MMDAVTTVVIAGLDPAIHGEKRFTHTCGANCLRHCSIDHRVKPGGDGGRALTPVVTKNDALHGRRSPPAEVN
jgi:hypothetical protein